MSYPSPPKWADRFLEWYCRPELLEEIQGDLYELFDKRVEYHKHPIAQLRYFWDVLRSCRLSTIKYFNINLSTIMFQHYLKITFRNILKHKSYAAINILGLTVGIVTSLLIYLWVQDEISFNTFHEKGDQIHKIMVNFRTPNGESYTWSNTPYPLGPQLVSEYPEIESTHYLGNWYEVLLSRGDQRFKESGLAVDSLFLESFSFPLLQGSTEFDNLHSIIITDEVAEKFFGRDWQNQDILGETLQMSNQRPYVITGIISSPPTNSTIQFDFLTSLTQYLELKSWNKVWGNYNNATYARLDEKADPLLVEDKIKQVINDRLSEEDRGGTSIDLLLHPLEDEYLYSEFEDGQITGGRIEYIRIFSMVGIFLLLIACVNFTNLATARAGIRTREIGVKKAIGASRNSLTQQFMGESILLTAISYIISIILIQLILPYFNTLTDKELTIDFGEGSFWFFSMIIILLTGIVAGIYPALFLSSTKTIDILKSQVGSFLRGAGLRKALVVVQFSLSVLMIVTTLVVYRQIQFIKQKNLGMDKENVVMVPLEGIDSPEKYETFRQRVELNPNIQSVTAANFSPLMVWNSTTSVSWDGKPDKEDVMFHIIQTDYNYLETMKIPLTEGRTHNPEIRSDSTGYLVNEAAVKAMDMKEPVGQSLSTWGIDGKIIGIVKDHHIASLYDPIEPMVIRYSPRQTNILIARTTVGGTEAAIEHIKELKTEFSPVYPFEYEFLDQSYEEQYRSEMITGTLAKYFASIAIFISCLGLLGLASFTAARRTKEISIRKVMGASVSDLVILLTQDFTRLVLVGIVIALPVGAYLSLQWLENFAYHIDLDPSIFIWSAIGAILIAWMTISYQAIRSATHNPAKFLRSE